MDPDPRKRAGGGEGERRREVLRLLFLGEGDEGALASSSPICLMDPDPYQFVQTTKHKDENNK